MLARVVGNKQLVSEYSSEATLSSNTHLLEQSLQRLIGDFATDLAARSHAHEDLLNLRSELRAGERYPGDWS